MSGNRAAIRGFTAWFLACLPAIAAADLYSASRAYDEQKFELAFEQFRELAELGQVHAQENLAAMYVGGEGVQRDNVAGYAWALIARENGGREAMQSIIDQLGPHMTDKARERVAELQARFGAAALKARLLPRIFDSANNADPATCRMVKQAKVIYPQSAVRSGVQGMVHMEFTVMPDGRARNPRPVYAVPTGVFEESARRTILRSQFSPGTANGTPVPCTTAILILYRVRGGTLEMYPQLEKILQTTRENADKGDARAQMLYGLLISSMPQVRKPRSESIPYFVKAAQAGLPTAQFLVGLSSIKGWGCEMDTAKAVTWLHRAAAADQADAQVLLASHILRSQPSPQEVATAITWLERAVASGSRDGRFYLAAVLAAGDDAARRDPARALSVLSEVMRDVDDDPTAFEIRAAAHAMQGLFDEARKDQRKALRMAQKLGWETSSVQSRLKSYEASKSWTGDLFAF